jgi:transposase
MLEAETNHQIILLYLREGLSQRKIAKKLKMDRRTVKEILIQYEQFKNADLIDQDKPLRICNVITYTINGLIL